MLIGVDAHNLEGKRTGVGRYVFNLLQEWSKLDPKSQIPNPKFRLYFKDEIPADLTKSDNFECKILKTSSTAKFMNWNLPRAAAEDKVDILFCPDYRGPIWYRGKTAITLHDISYEARPEDFNWPSLSDRILLKWASKRTAKKASLIFAPSEFSKQEVIRFFGIAADKIVVTLESVDPLLLNIAGNDDVAATKGKYGLKDKFAFYVGSIFTRRHLPEVISAFERLAQEGDYQLLLGGRDYTKDQAVDEMARKLNAKLGREAVLRVDFINDKELKLLYSACAFFIWLSDYEGFGLPVLEAMSLGAPVITTDGSSLNEVAGEAALLIEDNTDINEIHRAMHKITRDNILREDLVARGREQAAKFSWQKCAAKTLEHLTANI